MVEQSVVGGNIQRQGNGSSRSVETFVPDTIT